jgi:phosphohistidine phosphatase
MAKQLWLLRHGEAEPHGARADTERRLTARGEEQSALAGAALAALGCDFGLCVTSPKVRARDTALRAAAPLGLEVVEHLPLASGFDRAEALALAAAVGDDERILVVGHEPDFSQVVHDLTGARIDFKKGAVAAVRLHGATSGELLALLRPKDLAAVAAGAPEAV